MKMHVRTLTPLGLLLALQACGNSTAFVKSRPVDPSLTQPCNQATLLPERELSQSEALSFWLRDRVSLAECRERHALLVGAE